MAAAYTPDAKFSDPVFDDLTGNEPGAMWRMLTERADDLVIELAEHDASEESGTAHWIATYTFTQTGRKVVNDVHAHFRFRDGLIAEHMDDFSFYNWSKQALKSSYSTEAMDRARFAARSTCRVRKRPSGHRASACSERVNGPTRRSAPMPR